MELLINLKIGKLVQQYGKIRSTSPSTIFSLQTLPKSFKFLVANSIMIGISFDSFTEYLKTYLAIFLQLVYTHLYKIRIYVEIHVQE